MKSDEVQTEHRILVMFFMKNAQGSLSMNIERAEKLCNDLAIAIIQAKEHANLNSLGKSESLANQT